MPQQQWLNLNLTIDAVDGDTCYTLTTPSATAAIKFLDNYDHEGANIMVTLLLHSEMVYKVLDFCASLEQTK